MHRVLRWCYWCWQQICQWVVLHWWGRTQPSVETIAPAVLSRYEDKYWAEIRRMDKTETYDQGDMQRWMHEYLERKQTTLADKRFTGYKDQLKKTKQKEWLEEAREYAWNEARRRRWKHLEHCFVMECTPVGNVVMCYNLEHLKFVYYSDTSVPYRFLQTVARKFVMQFCCRPLYLDMDEEVRLLAERYAACKKEEPPATASATKSVYAKLKDYNDGAGKPPRSSSSSKTAVQGLKKAGAAPVLTDQHQQALEHLKARCNSFLHQGKLVNFSFLQPVKRTYTQRRTPPLTPAMTNTVPTTHDTKTTTTTNANTYNGNSSLTYQEYKQLIRNQQTVE